MTAIPAFCDMGYNSAAFDREITTFQADPVAYFDSHPIVQRIPAWRPKS